VDLLADFAPGALFVSLVVGLVGGALFLYGRKADRWPQQAAGILLCVYPWMVSGVWPMLLVGAAILVGLWLIVRMGY